MWIKKPNKMPQTDLCTCQLYYYHLLFRNLNTGMLTNNNERKKKARMIFENFEFQNHRRIIKKEKKKPRRIKKKKKRWIERKKKLATPHPQIEAIERPKKKRNSKVIILNFDERNQVLSTHRYRSTLLHSGTQTIQKYCNQTEWLLLL